MQSIMYDNHQNNAHVHLYRIRPQPKAKLVDGRGVIKQSIDDVEFIKCPGSGLSSVFS
jgi:hypothetical protein